MDRRSAAPGAAAAARLQQLGARILSTFGKRLARGAGLERPSFSSSGLPQHCTSRGTQNSHPPSSPKSQHTRNRPTRWGPHHAHLCQKGPTGNTLTCHEAPARRARAASAARRRHARGGRRAARAPQPPRPPWLRLLPSRLLRLLLLPLAVTLRLASCMVPASAGGWLNQLNRMPTDSSPTEQPLCVASLQFRWHPI